MGKSKTFEKVMGGRADANISFSALRSLVLLLGFEHRGTEGSHQVFAREGIPEIINLQKTGAQAKPYQVKQVREIIKRYNLTLGE